MAMDNVFTVSVNTWKYWTGAWTASVNECYGLSGTFYINAMCVLTETNIALIRAINCWIEAVEVCLNTLGMEPRSCFVDRLKARVANVKGLSAHLLGAPSSSTLNSSTPW